MDEKPGRPPWLEPADVGGDVATRQVDEIERSELSGLDELVAGQYVHEGNEGDESRRNRHCWRPLPRSRLQRTYVARRVRRCWRVLGLGGVGPRTAPEERTDSFAARKLR